MCRVSAATPVSPRHPSPVFTKVSAWVTKVSADAQSLMKRSRASTCSLTYSTATTSVTQCRDARGLTARCRGGADGSDYSTHCCRGLRAQQVNAIEISPTKQFVVAAGNPQVRLYDVNTTTDANPVSGSVLLLL